MRGRKRSMVGWVVWFFFLIKKKKSEWKRLNPYIEKFSFFPRLFIARLCKVIKTSKRMEQILSGWNEECSRVSIYNMIALWPSWRPARFLPDTSAEAHKQRCILLRLFAICLGLLSIRSLSLPLLMSVSVAVPLCCSQTTNLKLFKLKGVTPVDITLSYSLEALGTASELIKMIMAYIVFSSESPELIQHAGRLDCL